MRIFITVMAMLFSVSAFAIDYCKVSFADSLNKIESDFIYSKTGKNTFNITVEYKNNVKHSYDGSIDSKGNIHFNLGVPAITVKQLKANPYFSKVSKSIMKNGVGRMDDQIEYVLDEDNGCSLFNLNLIQFIVHEWEYYG